MLLLAREGPIDLDTQLHATQHCPAGAASRFPTPHFKRSSPSPPVHPRSPPLQGRALNDSASRNCKVVVVGNPCNTNALIAMENAPNIPRKNFHALTRLDENRAKCQLALKSGKFYTSISRMAIWGNHSTTQVRCDKAWVLRDIRVARIVRCQY